ncbi:MAG: restriction endonuclease subunit S [Pseudomonadota bacterium]
MASESPITEVVEFNPSRQIKRGTVAPFVDMAALPENQRDISYIAEREFTGGGSRFQNGDTLFARITPCLENGKTAKVNALPDGVVAHGSTEFIVMAAKAPEYDEDYVYYLARHPEFRAFAEARMEGTSGRQRVSWQALADFTFALPSPGQRKTIGSVLRKLDDKIDLNRRINQTLEAMAQAIFKSWFVDFDPVKAKIAAKAALTPALSQKEREENVLRAAMSAISGKSDTELDTLPPEHYAQLAATAALFPDEMEESELGEIPRGWVVGKYGELATLAKGSVNPLLTPELVFEHYSLPAFDAGRQPVIENGSEIKSNKTRFTKGTVLQSKLNPHIPRVWFPSSVAKSAICSTEFLPWVAVTPATPEFVYCLLSSPNFEALIRGLVTGTSNSHQRVKPDQVASLPTVIPPSEVLGAFGTSTAQIFSFVGTGIEQMASLSALRDTLLPKLLSGELSVTEAMAEAQP